MNDPQGPFVVLTKVMDQGAAHMIRGVMEANDIPCVVFDDHGAGLGMGIFEIRVMVVQDYLPKAQNLLKDLEQA